MLNDVELKFKQGDLIRLKSVIARVPKKVQAALRKALANEGRLVIAKSQEFVPVVSGTLKASKFLKRSKTGGSVTRISLGYEVNQTGKIDYAPIVEHGSELFNVKFTGRHYLRRAVNSLKSGRKKRISKFVRAELKKG